MRHLRNDKSINVNSKLKILSTIHILHKIDLSRNLLINLNLCKNKNSAKKRVSRNVFKKIYRTLFDSSKKCCYDCSSYQDTRRYLIYPHYTSTRVLIGGIVTSFYKDNAGYINNNVYITYKRSSENIKKY